MSWRDCSGFNYVGDRCTATHGCGLIGCPAEGTKDRARREAKVKQLNEDEIKGTTQPIRIGASIPVSILRERFLDTGVNHVIKIGREMFGDGLTDAQLVAIARKEATLRGFTPTLTYHDKRCETCGGRGYNETNNLQSEPCASCGGDGFAPPIGRDS